MNIEYNSMLFMNDTKKKCKCKKSKCSCKNNEYHEWAWDKVFETPRLQLDERNQEVKFHPGYSVGTAAIRGNKLLSKNRHHYWEVKMLTPIYGTDVMIGVGTDKVDLTSTSDSFVSLLGRDAESWGYSYKGYLQHNGQIKEYAACFTRGSLVGVHLDMWKGTLEYFLDGKPLGIAFTGLRGLDLYPMVSSTAAKSKMKIICCVSIPASLQTNCLSVLKPVQRAYLKAAFPGLDYLSKSVFANVLQKCNDDDREEDYEFPSEFFVLEDFDFTLVRCKKLRKKRCLDQDYLSDIPATALKALILKTNSTIFH